MMAPRGALFKAASLTPRRIVYGLSLVKSNLRGAIANWRCRALIADEFPSSDTKLLAATADTTVLRVAPTNGPPVVVKVATSSTAKEQLKSEIAALEELARWVERDPSLPGVASIERRGRHPLGNWYAQTEILGAAASTVEVAPDFLVAEAIRAVAPFHAKTTRVVTADERDFERIVGEPVDIVRRWRPQVGEGLDVVANFLREHLMDRTLVLSRLHGDFAPSNVIWDVEATAISGIVDWGLGPALLPPEIDDVHFFVSLHTQPSDIEYGETVLWLLGDGMSSPEAQMVATLLAAGPNEFTPTVGLVLVWLHHASIGLHKSVGYRKNPIWLTKNVDVVVEALARDLHSP